MRAFVDAQLALEETTLTANVTGMGACSVACVRVQVHDEIPLACESFLAGFALVLFHAGMHQGVDVHLAFGLECFPAVRFCTLEIPGRQMGVLVLK